MKRFIFCLSTLLLFPLAAYTQVPLLPKEPIEIECNYKGLDKKLYFLLDFKNKDFINLQTGQSLGKLNATDKSYLVLEFKYNDDYLSKVKVSSLVDDALNGTILFTLDRSSKESTLGIVRAKGNTGSNLFRFNGKCIKYYSKRSI